MSGKMAKSNEPFWWALFGAGGMVAALLLPITILLTSLFVATELVATDRLWVLAAYPLTKLYLFVVISLPLFHWAHRFRFTLADLGVKVSQGVLAVLCYGSAIAGTVLTGLMLLGIWPR
jgi:fumarate reductase subunit D